MKVKVKIKEGHHSPSLLLRFWYFRVWLFFTPTEVEIKNAVIIVANPFWWLIRSKEEVQYIKEQISKFAGVAYGWPAKTENNKSWHPNSMRFGGNLLDRYFLYYYRNGKHNEDEIFGDSITLKRVVTFPIRFAYSLFTYSGGVYPAPCDLYFEYEIKYKGGFSLSIPKLLFAGIVTAIVWYILN